MGEWVYGWIDDEWRDEWAASVSAMTCAALGINLTGSTWRLRRKDTLARKAGIGWATHSDGD